MNKTLEAWLRGYVAFKVNKRRFWRYNAANAEADRLIAEKADITFFGRHIFKGWVLFLSKHVYRPRRDPVVIHYDGPIPPRPRTGAKQ